MQGTFTLINACEAHIYKCSLLSLLVQGTHHLRMQPTHIIINYIMYGTHLQLWATYACLCEAHFC